MWQLPGHGRAGHEAWALLGLPALWLAGAGAATEVAGTTSWLVPGAERLAVLEGVSLTCKDDLRKYLLCDVMSGLYIACATQQLVNSSTMQHFLGCASASPSALERLRICQQRCEDLAGSVVNETLRGPCPAQYQAMHGFSAPLNIFTVGGVDTDMNISRPMILPLPNIKGFGGPTVLSYGQPEKCAEVRGAQYCVLSGLLGSGPMPNMQTTFAVGNCLPRSCSEAELARTLAQLQQGALRRLQLNVQCDLVRPLGRAEGAGKQLEDLLGWGGTAVEYPSKIRAKPGFWVMAALCALLLLLTVAGTTLDWRREAKRRQLAMPLRTAPYPQELAPAARLPLGTGLLSLDAEEAPQEKPVDHPSPALPLASEARELVAPRGPAEDFLCHWSLLRNGRSLLRGRPAELSAFACMDAVRVLSMGQVILGHSYVYAISSAGFANMEQFNPPYGLMGRTWFQVIPGCFYGVDSFFVLSGFFCAFGLERKVFCKPESRSPRRFGLMYLKFVVHRYLRLVPLEMFCIFLCLYMLPQMGSGILWNMDRPNGVHCSDAAGAGKECEHLWWTNLLFLQDLDRYVAKCFGHTWYLANDFQLYITAPLFALARSLDRRLGWALAAAVLLGSVAASAAMTAHYGWVPEMLAGASKGYPEKFYFKPWCRAPAFVVGIAIAWLWPGFLDQYKGRHTTGLGRLCSYGLSALALLLCLVATFGRVAFFQCDILRCMEPDTSPVSRPFQYIWGSLSILTWCIGLGIVMVLCFQDRFLPLLQGLLCLGLWQPIAKLSYAAYLIHTSVLILSYCQRDRPIDWSGSSFAFNFVSFVVVSLLAAFCLWAIVEKPLANLQAKLLGGLGE